MQALPIIQSLWVGAQLSLMEQLSIASFLHHGHPYHLYVYNEVAGLPRGVVIKDANAIVPADQIFSYKNGAIDTYSGFSNLFRYKLLLEQGGIWADTDIICLRAWQFVQPYLFASQGSHLFPYGSRFIKHRFLVNPCVMQAPKEAELVAFCYENASRRDPKTLAFGQIGPQLLTEVVKTYKMQKYVARASAFCPINYFRWQHLIHDKPWRNRIESWKLRMTRAFGLHLWHVMWQRNGANPNATFAQNSLYETYKRIYLPSIPDHAFAATG